MKILITGIHGFVGSNLTAALSGKHILYGLDIVAPPKQGVEATYSWEDLDAGRIPEVDAVIHLAGKAHDTKNKANASVYFNINTGLTQKIFDWFLASKAHKFLFFSSVKAAADSVEGDLLTEEVVPKPIGPYGESKIKAEEYILSCCPDGGQQKPDKQVYILRPCMIHGPGNKGNLNLLYKVVSKGIPWPLGAFDNRRTFSSIDNVCFVVGELLMQDVPSGIYHMADDEPLSTNELIGTICTALGRKARIWHISPACIRFAARLGTRLHLPLNEERLHKLTENYVASNRKLKEALHINRMPVRATDGLHKTILSFKNTLSK